MSNILHEVVKSILVYEPEKALAVLRAKYPQWKLLRKTIFFTRPEYPLWRKRSKLPNRYLDALWVMGDDKHTYVVGHEVKTSWDSCYEEIEQIVDTYELLRISTLPGVYIKRPQKRFLFVWVRKNVLSTLREVLEIIPVGKYLVKNVGLIRFIPLEILMPHIRAKLKQLTLACVV